MSAANQFVSLLEGENLEDADLQDTSLLPPCSGCGQCCGLSPVKIRKDDSHVPRDVAVYDQNYENCWEIPFDEDGWCSCLNRETGKCNIYAQRPITCREFPRGKFCLGFFFTKR